MQGENRVAWREGMFLRPQHFQQQDRFVDALIRARTETLRPYPWGLTALKINASLASLGKFAVERCAGLFADGQPFSTPDDFPPPPPLDVPPDTRDAIVYLTLPARQAGAVEFQNSDEAGGDAARFLVDEEEAPDTFSNERARETIETARPNLRFGVTRDQTYGRITVGLARIREVQNGQLMFDERYIPPTLDVRVDPAPARVPDRHPRPGRPALRRAGAARGGGDRGRRGDLRQLPAAAGAEPLGTAADPPRKPADGAPRAALRVVRQHGWRAFDAGAGRPQAAAVSALRPREAAADLRAGVRGAAGGAVGGVRPLGRSSCRSSWRDPGPTSRASPTATSTSTASSIWRSRPAPRWTRSAPASRRWPRSARWSGCGRSSNSALPGVPLRHAPTPPPQIRVIPGYVYFELDRGAQDWRDFASATALGLHVAGDWPDLRLELWCVKRSTR